jgi:HEAT repeat protein
VEKSLRQRVLAQLAAIAIAGSTGLFEPTASLLTIPEAVIIDLVDDSDDDMKRRYLSLLAKDARTGVRERVAVAALALAKRQPADAEELLRSLAGDVSVRVRAAAGKSLAAMIESAPPFERPAIVGRWTLSPRASERAAIARALQTRTPVFVSDLALEELASDPAPDVRASAARAMARRIHEAPAAYARTLTRLSVDPDVRVERTARRLLAALTGVEHHAQRETVAKS